MKDLGLIRKQGRIVIVGGAAELPLNPVYIYANEVTMKGVLIYNINDDQLFETRETL